MQERKLTVRLSAKLLKAAKLKSVTDDKALSEVVRDLLAGWVDGSITLPQQAIAITAVVVERPDGPDEVIPMGPQTKRKRKDKPTD